MNLFPRQSSLFARLQPSCSNRTLFSQSGIPAEGALPPARVFLNKPTQHKGFVPSQKTVKVLAGITGFALACAWLGWFFRNVF
jgi:hypothetical protein